MGRGVEVQKEGHRGCWWLEGLTRGLEVISPSFNSQNCRFFSPAHPCQHQGHEVKKAINLILANFTITLKLLIIVVIGVYCTV